jgi:hypothetical protein
MAKPVGIVGSSHMLLGRTDTLIGRAAGGAANGGAEPRSANEVNGQV